MNKAPSFGLGPLPQFPAREWRELASDIEALGYRTLWIPDERFFRDVVATLAVTANATSTIGIGTSVTDPFIRHPALTAQWTASLDELSNGRMHIGIGAGFSGFSALGIDRVRPAKAIREMVELMRELWSGAVVDFQGELVQFRNARLDFEPLRDRIPCYIAGRGPLVLRLAGEIGEGVIIGSLAAEAGISFAFENIDQGLASSGRNREDIDIAIWLHTAVFPDREQAREAVRMIVVGVLLSSRPVLSRFGVTLDDPLKVALDGVRYIQDSPELMKVARMLSDDLVDQFSVAGPPEEVAARIRALRDAGVNHFALKPWLVPGQTLTDFARLVSEEVMPNI